MYRGMLISACVAAAFLLGCPIPTKESAPEQDMKYELHYKTALRYIGEGKTGQAIKELNKAQAIQPESAEVQQALGLAFQRKRFWEKAIEHYVKALQIDPTLTEARNNLGTVYLVKGRYDDAIKQFKESLKDPEYTTPENAQYNLGVAYFHKGDIDKAIHHYEQSLLLNEDNPGALYNLGYCFEQKKDYSKAKLAYQKALERDPRLKEAFVRLGALSEVENKYEEALEFYKKALDVDQSYAPAHLRAGAMYMKLKEPTKAMRAFEDAQEYAVEDKTRQKARESIKLIKQDKFRGIPKVSLDPLKKPAAQ